MINEKTSKNKCLETIKEIMNIKMLPPIMVKKVNELRDFYDYIIINDDVEKAANELTSIINAERCRYSNRSFILENY